MGVEGVGWREAYKASGTIYDASVDITREKLGLYRTTTGNNDNMERHTTQNTTHQKSTLAVRITNNSKHDTQHYVNTHITLANTGKIWHPSEVQDQPDHQIDCEELHVRCEPHFGE